MNPFIKKIKKIAKPAINNLKGKIGEAKVNRTLNPILFDKVEHRQVNNLVLMDDNGKSHQIDHIEIRQNGIFCIETKNYIGWVFGNETQEKWTQSLYTGEKNYFYNPLKQNRSHAFHLSKALRNKYKIIPLVVMANNNADKICSSSVINLNELKTYLNNYNAGVSYSIEEIEKIYNLLIRIKNNQISDSEHVENIKKTQDEIKSGICPRCGGKLVRRNGTYGPFYGCSNYPQCKFILSDNK